jgi:hypothetical protein
MGEDVLAAPVFGSTESFPGVTIGEWVPGQAASLSNPGTGGLGGAGDGYLLLSQSVHFNFGMRNEGSLYAGNWNAAGITYLSLSLNDVGADDAFEIHLSIGYFGNLWQYNVGFTPPEGQWQRFVVDLTNPSDFSQIIGAGTFADALATADRLLIRHDRPPFTQVPDPTSGDLGIDEVVLGDLPVPTRETSWGRLKALYR